MTIAKDDIEEKKEGNISAMPPGLVKMANEVADVAAYLLQNKQQTGQCQQKSLKLPRTTLYQTAV